MTTLTGSLWAWLRDYSSRIRGKSSGGRLCMQAYTYVWSPTHIQFSTDIWMNVHTHMHSPGIHTHENKKKIARNLWLCNISKKARKFSTDANIKAWNIKRWWPTDQRFVSIGRFLVQTSCLLPYTYIPKKKKRERENPVKLWKF